MEEFTDDKDFVSWKSTEEEEAKVKPNRNTDYQDIPWLQDKPDFSKFKLFKPHVELKIKLFSGF